MPFIKNKSLKESNLANKHKYLGFDFTQFWGVLIFIIFIIELKILQIIEKVLPPKYFYDGKFIEYLTGSERINNVDQSFRIVAQIYSRVINVLSPNQIKYAQFILFFCLLVLLVIKLKPNLNATNMFYFITFSFIGLVYMGQYSKDFWLVFLSFILVSNQKFKYYLGAIFIAFYGTFFRKYWLLILGFWVFNQIYYFRTRHKRSLAIILLQILLPLVISIFIFIYIFNFPIYNIASQVNDRRLGSTDAVTMLNLVHFGDNIFGYSLTYILQFFKITFPIFLLKNVSIQYYVIFALITSIWMPLLFWLKDFKNYEMKSFLLSFVLVQTFFEPDLGSALRHATPLLPVFLYLHFTIPFKLLIMKRHNNYP